MAILLGGWAILWCVVLCGGVMIASFIGKRID